MPIVADHVEIFSIEWLRIHGVLLLVIVVAAVLVHWMARLAVRRVQRRLQTAEGLTAELDLQRANTLTHALSYLTRVVIWTLALLLLLGQVGVNLGPLIAGAGIAGVALGFGAQSLVKDFLSGFFILLENQYGVGDVITVNADEQLTGKVEQIDLRVTQIRSYDGTLNFVPNGTIQLVGNKTRGWARAILDIGVGYGENVDRVRSVLEELFDELREDEDIKGWFLDGPSVVGVENLGEYEVVVRSIADVRPSKRWDAARELRRRIKARFDERGIEIPFPYRVMISKPADQAAPQPADEPRPR